MLKFWAISQQVASGSCAELELEARATSDAQMRPNRLSNPRRRVTLIRLFVDVQSITEVGEAECGGSSASAASLPMWVLTQRSWQRHRAIHRNEVGDQRQHRGPGAGEPATPRGAGCIRSGRRDPRRHSATTSVSTKNCARGAAVSAEPDIADPDRGRCTIPGRTLATSTVGWLRRRCRRQDEQRMCFVFARLLADVDVECVSSSSTRALNRIRSRDARSGRRPVAAECAGADRVVADGGQSR